MPISDQVLRDLRAIQRMTQNGLADSKESERFVFRMLPALLDELESLRDSTLPKDFLALYQAARMVTSALQTSAPSSDVECLALHVQRLAPLYDDVRMQLNLRSHRAREPHTVRVLGAGGESRIECDHTFKGTRNCVHCGKPFVALVRESRGEALQLASVQAAIRTEFDVVAVVLGPTLQQRVDTIVQSHRLGTRLDLVVQTMFILGMLDAEGMDPRAYVGEPKQHISHDGAFIRFALPHIGDAERLEVLRSVFAWLHAWLGEGDPLQPAAAAALAALPR